MILRLVIAMAIFLVVLRLGAAVIRFVGRTPPPPPEPGELRKLNATYECATCGMKMKVMLAPEQDPEAPRHCMQEMELVKAPD